MSNTNLPLNLNDPATLRAIERHLAEINESKPAIQKIQEGNLRASKQLQESFIRFVTPMNRLQSSITRMDETNRKITQMGTTYSKLQTSLEKNSNVLDKNLVSNRALISEIAKNYEQGVRINNGALTDLTQEMIATGQNTALQRKMNADQVLQTGNNTKAVQSINKTNKDVSDKYGVSNDRLIESLNSLKGVMDQASFFGPEAVTSFKNIATELKGKAGGANIEGGLQALFGVLGPGSENIAASRLLGAGGLRQKVAGGGSVGTEDLGPIFANLERIIGSSKGEFGAEIASARTGLGKDQMIQLMQLNNIMKSHFELSKEDQATQNEKFNNLKTLQDKQNDWYDAGAVQMLSLLGSINAAVIFAGGGFTQAAGMVTSFMGGKGPTIPSTGKLSGAAAAAHMDRAQGIKPKRQPMSRGTKVGMGMGVGLGIHALGGATGLDLGGTATGAGIGAMFGPLGMGIGALVGLTADIVKNTASSSEADKERVAQEKEKLDRDRAEENSKDVKRITFLTDYLRSRAGPSLLEDDESKLLLRRSAEAMEKIAERGTELTALSTK